METTGDPAGMSTDSTASEPAVLDAQRTRVQALVDCDLETLDRYVADDLVYVSPLGKVQGKAEVLESFRSGTVKVERLDYDDVSVRLYGDTAIVGYRAITRMLDHGDLIEGTTRSTAVYLRREGQWQLVSQHVCLIG